MEGEGKGVADVYENKLADRPSAIDMLGQARTWLLREKATLRTGRDLGWH